MIISIGRNNNKIHLKTFSKQSHDRVTFPLHDYDTLKEEEIRKIKEPQYIVQ